MSIAKITLKRGKEASPKRFHPWIFSGAIKRLPDNIQEGDTIEVYADNGDFLGIGYYESGTIAVRIFSFEKITPDYNFWKSKVQKAYDVRKNIGVANDSNTNTYRLIYAEGDGIPGLITDIYGETAVVQCHSKGVYKNREMIAKAIKDVLGNKIKNIYDKSEKTLHRTAGAKDGYLLNENPKAEDIVTENGNKFWVNWEEGQKTGFFIDQRDNRALLSKYCKDKTVLNTFCYTGGFSVYAVNAGAKEVCSIDVSKKAIELTDRNIELNNASEKHTSHVADTFDFLKENENKFDIIILDPPAFAKHTSSKNNAIIGYKRINQMALKQIKSGGLLFTFSCSQVVDKYTFTNTIIAAAIEAGRTARIIHTMSHPPDHAINIFHPEGEYLKGLVVYVD